MKILQNGNEISVLDLGTVEVGETKKYEYQILNDSQKRLESLKFQINDDEVKIVEAPVELLPGESKRLILEWTPTEKVELGKKVYLNILGKEVWQYGTLQE